MNTLSTLRLARFPVCRARTARGGWEQADRGGGGEGVHAGRPACLPACVPASLRRCCSSHGCQHDQPRIRCQLLSLLLTQPITLKKRRPLVVSRRRSMLEPRRHRGKDKAMERGTRNSIDGRNQQRTTLGRMVPSLALMAALRRRACPPSSWLGDDQLWEWCRAEGDDWTRNGKCSAMFGKGGGRHPPMNVEAQSAKPHTSPFGQTPTEHLPLSSTEQRFTKHDNEPRCCSPILS